MARTLAAIVAHPSLWTTSARQAGRVAPRHWWRRAPFLPLPDADYLRFRMETQYGSGHGVGAGAAIDPDDLIVFLQWCRRSGR